MRVAMAKNPRWRLKGSVVIACNCDYGCPCNFNALPTHGDCEGGWTWHVKDGQRDGVSLSGLNFSLICDWPAAIHQGNGEAIILIDERADEQQRAAINGLLHGEDGGPWAILINTFSTIHDPKYVPFEVTVKDEFRAEVRAGEVLTLATEPIRNPVTQVEVHPRAVLPEGFIFKDGALVSSSAFKVSGAVNYDHSGKYAAVSEFEYQNA
jgi:hypothetical protein